MSQDRGQSKNKIKRGKKIYVVLDKRERENK